MLALLNSIWLVTIAEIGDKTQLLAIFLAARFKKPVPIIWGVLLATLLNHSIAAYGGRWVAVFLNDDVLSIIVGVLFIMVGIWALIPDDDHFSLKEGSSSAFSTSFIAFFLAENGDKTQLATITLGAEYNAVLLVILGTTIGMMIANIPAVLLGQKLLNHLSLKTIRMMAAVSFIVCGVWKLLEVV